MNSYEQFMHGVMGIIFAIVSIALVGIGLFLIGRETVKRSESFRMMILARTWRFNDKNHNQ